MKRICLKEECIGCLNCYNACKVEAIKLIQDELGFTYAEIDEEKCVKCAVCKNKCPILNTQEKQNLINECYATKNKDESVRLKSSSGGMFYEFAKYVISKGGAVYGAILDSTLNVVHKRIESIDEVGGLMGSKYVQSNVKNVCVEVKQDLEQGTIVLFTGTPCQIAALKVYLGKEYEKLYLQDFVCHGVGSKKVLDRHIQEIKQELELSNITDINFRDKASGWKRFSLSIKAKEGTYSKDLMQDNFMKTFLKNLCLRESCYKCKYKGEKRMSDITLADFWGVDKVITDFDDDKGASAVIINTNKGKELFENIKDNIITCKVEYDDISSNNICLENPPIYNRHRENFIKDIECGVKLSQLKEEYYTR